MLENDYKHAHYSDEDVLIQLIAYNFSYHPCPENKTALSANVQDEFALAKMSPIASCSRMIFLSQ